MTEAMGPPPDRDGGGAPRRRRSETTPRQRRKAKRQGSRRQTSRRRTRSTSAAPPTGSPAGSAGSADVRRRRSQGSRKVVKRRERRRRRTWLTVLLVLIAVLVAGAVFVVTGLLDRAIELVTSEEGEEDPAAVTEGQQSSMVVVTYDEDAPSAEALRVLVLASDRDTGEGVVLMIPTGTVVDVPGRGSFELGEAHALGGSSLVVSSLENLLGARFDGTVELSVQGWAALLDRVEGFEVEVRSRLVQLEEDGGEVRFEPGPQFLDGPRLAEYLAFQAQGETQLEALLRVQQVTNGMLDRLHGDAALLDRVLADDAPALDTDDPAHTRALLEDLADARARQELVVLTLPVSPLGGEDVYQADAERVDELMDQHFAASRPTGTVGSGRALQILNGNGAPGIGEDVSARLRDGGYRVVLTGNADDFDHDVTSIVVYEESAEQVAIAEDIQERLGVGQIVRSEVPQSVVDVTIVVGHDYLD